MEVGGEPGYRETALSKKKWPNMSDTAKKLHEKETNKYLMD